MNPRYRPVALLGLVTADVLTLWRAWPRLHGTDLRAPQAWIDRVGADAALARLAGAGLWLAAVWLAAGLFALAAGVVPGPGGRAARRISGILLPRAVLRLVAGAAGLGVLIAPVAAGARTPAPATRTPSTPVPAMSAPAWPTDDPLPSPSWPTTTEAPPARPVPAPADVRPVPTVKPEPTSGPVTVHPGDSLWSITAAQWRHDHHARPSRRQVAAQWPRWWGANRAVVGDQPDLIHPGQTLHPPVEESS